MQVPLNVKMVQQIIVHKNVLVLFPMERLPMSVAAMKVTGSIQIILHVLVSVILLCVIIIIMIIMINTICGGNIQLADTVHTVYFG